MPTNRFLPLLKSILYVLAAIVLGFGLIVGIGLLISSAGVQNMLVPFQFVGGEVVANLIAPYLRSLISGLGVATLVFSLVLSLLLFATGRLLAYNLSLEARLARLEAALPSLEKSL